MKKNLPVSLGILLFFTALMLTLDQSQAQSISCLDTFHDFDPIQVETTPNSRNIVYTPSFKWHTDSQCLLIGSAVGLWLYDLDQPDTPLLLADADGRVINNIAVNPQTSEVAFSAAQESLVYFLSPAGKTSTLRVKGVVTDISFSSDGSLVAVASSDLSEEMGFFFDARVQIWNSEHEEIAKLTSDTDIIVASFFSPDNKRLLTDGFKPGYLGNDVEYWDIASTSRLWNYDDLLRDLPEWSLNDPLIVTTIAMKDETLALGGIDGFHDYDEFYGNGVHLWNPESENRFGEIVVYRRSGDETTDFLADIDLNAEGSILATARIDGILQFWNTSDSSLITETTIEVSEIREISYSPDDRYLAILSNDEILIWNTETEAEMTSFSLP